MYYNDLSKKNPDQWIRNHTGKSYIKNKRIVDPVIRVKVKRYILWLEWSLTDFTNSWSRINTFQDVFTQLNELRYKCMAD